MKIGVFSHGWWKPACEALGHEIVDLPSPQHTSGNVHAADLAGRIANGAQIAAKLAEQRVDLMLDNSGCGLGFVNDRGGDRLKPVHEATDNFLFSHFIDPIVTVFQGLGWSEIWQCLQSRSWVKCVWDRAQAIELHNFGVPNVVHLPMAAVNRRYNTEPIDPTSQKPIVSFVGGQNTKYFSANAAVPSGNLLAGTLAQAAQADKPDVSFYDVYHELYGIGEPVKGDDDQATQIRKTLAYFTSKLFFNAARCVHQRDRFVIFASRVLGDQFFLAGKGWQEVYGISAAPPFDTVDGYLNHFRESAINLNLVNGNAETGLNMRHFEITAAGGFMLCYHQPELENHFEIGRECVVFRSEQELVEKVRYFLGHPEERVAIARAGQMRTLSNHLYSHRLETLLDGVTLGPLPVEYSKRTAWDDMKALLPEPRVVLDCGANVGQTAATFRKAFPHAEIYSFEPVRAVFEQLRAKCEELGVHAVRKAVGDRDGQATIHLTASSEAHSLLGFQEGNPCEKWTKEVGEEIVDICTLDRWCRDSEVDPLRVDLLKLDVQGAELQALYGAKELLNSVRLIYLEVSFVPLYKDCPLHAEIDSFLKECGFRRHGIYPSDQPHHWGDALYIKT